MLDAAPLRHLRTGLLALALWFCPSAAVMAVPGYSQDLPPSPARQLEGTPLPGSTQFSDAITSFYAARADRPVWVEQGKLNQDGFRLVQTLINSHEHGIDLPDLNLFAASGVVGRPLGEYISAYDRRLTELFLRYAQAVRVGRTTPNDTGITWAIERPVFDPRQVLDRLQHGNPSDLLNEQPPPHAGYRQLMAALARYRQIEVNGGWPVIPGGPVLELGQSNDRVVLLRQRLAREGYILDERAETRLFDEALQRTVRAFQENHGLVVDGRVGNVTLSALNQSAASRVAQIETNMERWRWMPRELPLHRIEVNIAAAELTLFDSDNPILTIRTVVGAPRHRTPMLQATVQAIIVNPPWNVPVSIAVNEIQPRLRRDPDYLRGQDMRIVDRPYDPYGSEIDWKNLPRGTHFRFRQQPGPLNALGRLKFDMPNRFDVYLHDTPAKTLFAGAKRALSHGCIRLQHPDVLATYLLGGSDERWTGEWIERETVRIPLRAPVAVYLLYWTVYAASDGEMQFRDDVYGYDRVMEVARRRAIPDQLLSQREVGGCKAS